jgi:hypothetical protein
VKSRKQAIAIGLSEARKKGKKVPKKKTSKKKDQEEIAQTQIVASAPPLLHSSASLGLFLSTAVQWVSTLHFEGFSDRCGPGSRGSCDVQAKNRRSL